MCYPKPGPRCSASAAARLARAKHAAYSYFIEHKDQEKEDWAELDALSAAREEAQLEYDITPAGIRALERQAGEPNAGSYSLQKLEDAKARRAARLKAIKLEGDQGDLVHSGHQGQVNEVKAFRYKNSRLAVANETLKELPANSPDVDALLDESEVWVNKLTADEIEALHWYSMGGYEEINGGLSNPNWQGRQDGAGGFKRGAPESVIELLDSALEKVDPVKSAVVYRRHFFYNDQDPIGTFANLTFEEMAERFPVGSVYKPGFFMSTSLNPSNIGMPMRTDEKSFMVRLEILTSRGAAMPAVSNSGTSEQELLLPRDGEYLVVNNDQKISISRGSKTEQVRVIQLQELPKPSAAS